MNFSEAYYHTIQSIAAAYGDEEAKAVAKLLFREKYDATSLLTADQRTFTETEHLQTDIERLKQHEPLQYILGYTYFMDMKINVNPSVLIPRPETEELVMLAKKAVGETTHIIADICTGSGCIALAMHDFFRDKKILATDISEEALKTAELNEWLNFGEKKIAFRQHDILSGKWPFDIPDIIICNPPYIEKYEATNMSQHVLKHEPDIALFVYDDDALLFYKAVIELFLPHRFPKIFFELNPFHYLPLVTFCNEHSLDCEIVKDMQGKERFATVTKSGGY